MTVRVLVVDHAHSLVCGIHDIGLRITTALRQSQTLDVNHLDIGDVNGWQNAMEIVTPNVVIVNYRPDLMPWIPAALAAPRSVVVFAVLHQYEEATADARARTILADGFNHVLALDPLLAPTEPRLLAVGRPIPLSVEHDGSAVDPVTVGSFGFAFPHKGFVDVAAEAVALGRPTVYNLHMPEAFFNGANGADLYTEGILAGCAEVIDGSQVDLWYTNDHCDEDKLVERLSLNDVNCLFYVPGQPDAGLSSAVDYLIAARRPMLLTDCAMFRHATDAPRFPEVRLGDILDDYDNWQQKADELYDWHQGRLVADIEKIVSER